MIRARVATVVFAGLAAIAVYATSGISSERQLPESQRTSSGAIMVSVLCAEKRRGDALIEKNRGP